MQTYNRANAEWTDQDAEIYPTGIELSQFDKRIKDMKDKSARILIIPDDTEPEDTTPEIVDTIQPEAEPEYELAEAGEYIDWAAKGKTDV